MILFTVILKENELTLKRVSPLTYDQAVEFAESECARLKRLGWTLESSYWKDQKHYDLFSKGLFGRVLIVEQI